MGNATCKALFTALPHNEGEKALFADEKSPEKLLIRHANTTSERETVVGKGK